VAAVGPEAEGAGREAVAAAAGDGPADHRVEAAAAGAEGLAQPCTMRFFFRPTT
jgi:hypothetical protein